MPKNRSFALILVAAFAGLVLFSGCGCDDKKSQESKKNQPLKELAAENQSLRNENAALKERLSISDKEISDIKGKNKVLDDQIKNIQSKENKAGIYYWIVTLCFMALVVISFISFTNEDNN